MASASYSTLPTMEPGDDPSASMTANSRRRSNVAISIVFAMPKLAIAKMTTMKIQYRESASEMYSASTGLSSAQGAIAMARSSAPRAAARRPAVAPAAAGSAVATAISWIRPGSSTTSVCRSVIGITAVAASNSTRPVL